MCKFGDIFPSFQASYFDELLQGISLDLRDLLCVESKDLCDVKLRSFLYLLSQFGRNLQYLKSLQAVCLSAAFLPAVRLQDYKDFQDPCPISSCNPQVGDLLVGRAAQLSASSTCGLDGPQNYCIIGYLEKCFICDSQLPYHRYNSPNSHRIENVITNFDLERKLKWWQSENGVHHVSIQLNLETMFQFSHLVLTFKSFRPAAMLVERSKDFGRSWKVVRYFAEDCSLHFPSVSTAPARSIDDVVCDSRYSGSEPSSDGEVVLKALDPVFKTENPHAPNIQDLTTVTNIRVNFTRLFTLGDTLLSRRRRNPQDKYYYSVYNMVVQGSCFCNGHASQCVPMAGVHGQCVCQHNTAGENCERCQDFHHDSPWRPGGEGAADICRACKCHGHSDSCHFDAARYKATGGVSGGVCDDCGNNRMGPQCEQCRPFLYQDLQRAKDDPHACIPCNCDPVGSRDGGQCDSLSGQCVCKENVEGQRCDRCKHGFFSLRQDDPAGCQGDQIPLFVLLSFSTKVLLITDTIEPPLCHFLSFWGIPCPVRCSPEDGQCRCLPNMIGRRCSDPAPGYFLPPLNYFLYEAELTFPLLGGNSSTTSPPPSPSSSAAPSSSSLVLVGLRSSRTETKSKRQVFYMFISVLYLLSVCRCNVIGSIGPSCSKLGGFCQCKANVIGRCCDACAPVTFGFGPEGCKRCDCDPHGSVSELCDQVSGQCACRSETAGQRCDRCQMGFWGFPSCRSCECNGLSEMCDGLTGDCLSCREHTTGPSCERCVEGYYGDPISRQACQLCLCPDVLSSGRFFATSCQHDPQSLRLICNCQEGHTGVSCDRCSPGFYGDLTLPGAVCKECPCNNNINPDDPNSCNSRTGECLHCLHNTIGLHCQNCKPGYYGNALTQDCKECSCDRRGTQVTRCPLGRPCFCDLRTGQCPCRTGVIGKLCDECEDRYWNLNIASGCQPCSCDPVNSISNICDKVTGRCPCHPEFGGRHCDECRENHFRNPDLQCIPCDCNPEGTKRPSCDPETSECICRAGVTGIFCDECAPGFNTLFPACEQCHPCNALWTQIVTDVQQAAQKITTLIPHNNMQPTDNHYLQEMMNMRSVMDSLANLRVISPPSVEKLEKMSLKVR
uniref:Laminin, beta 4 n=1 Tax=Oreochromis niloticus TaxID=8128 RepID=A0A669FBY6_ORENI